MSVPLGNVLVLCTLFCFGCAAKLPSFIVPCKRDDPAIGRCLEAAAEAVRPRMGRGIPELLVPPTDPLVLPRVTLSTPQGLNGTFSNLKIYKLDTFQLEKVEMDVQGNKAQVRVRFPQLRIETDYALLGNILVLQLNAQGFSHGDYKNVVGDASVNFVRHTKKGKEHMRIKDLNIKLDVGKPSLTFERLFGDDAQATKQANQLINNNIESIIDTVRPVVYNVLTEILQGLVGRVFDKYSVDELFPSS